MPNFDRVVIKTDARQSRNIHIAVHPFRMDRSVMMMAPGAYEYLGVPQSKRPLADRLWEAIPGLSVLFFQNGGIIIQHQGLFADEDIVAAAEEVIRPHLEEQLRLDQFGKGE